jgi:enoyl-CoA hydratase/carnithine racemase
MSVLLTRRDGDVLIATINRPDAANALNAPVLDALVAALADGATDDAIRAVVITATGDRVFSAGADLKEYAELDRASAGSRRRATLARALLAVVDFPKPLVVALQGKAIGAGCMLSQVADAAIAAEGAELRMPEVALDMPSPLGVAILAWRAGLVAARYLVQTGAPVDAAGALALGMIDAVVARDALEAQALERTRAAHGGYAYRVNKAWINRDLRRAMTEATAEAERLHQARHGGSGRTTHAD